MKIYRNGKAIELTETEINHLYLEIQRRNYADDITLKLIEDYDIDPIKEGINVARLVEEIRCEIMDNDTICDCEQDACRKVIGNYLKERAKFKEENEMKKYTLKDYKEFCDEVLVAPPCFEDEDIDELEWYEANKVHIIKGNHEMVLDYMADVANELEYALREMYEEEYGDGTPTTGNTFGSEYRPSELKDVVRYFIMCRYENWGGLNWFDYANQAVVEMCDIKSVIGVYEQARKVEKNIDFKCNWSNFKVETLKDATEDGIKKIILDWVGSELEISYDPSTDKSFIIDYTFKDSGEFIDWSWGRMNDDVKQTLIEGYKAQIFEN